MHENSILTQKTRYNLPPIQQPLADASGIQGRNNKEHHDSTSENPQQ